MDLSLALYHTKAKLKFDLDTLIDLWNSLEFDDPMPWARCAFGNIFNQACFES